eukprot:SAG22_NODE_924_length_6477_cov_50.153183_2_plen_193_part_00
MVLETPTAKQHTVPLQSLVSNQPDELPTGQRWHHALHHTKTCVRAEWHAPLAERAVRRTSARADGHLRLFARWLPRRAQFRTIAFKVAAASSNRGRVGSRDVVRSEPVRRKQLSLLHFGHLVEQGRRLAPAHPPGAASRRGGSRADTDAGQLSERHGCAAAAGGALLSSFEPPAHSVRPAVTLFWCGRQCGG